MAQAWHRLPSELGKKPSLQEQEPSVWREALVQQALHFEAEQPWQEELQAVDTHTPTRFHVIPVLHTHVVPLS